MEDLIWVKTNHFNCEKKCVIFDMCAEMPKIKTKNLGVCCDSGAGYYKFVVKEEPVKIQTEYELIKQAYDALNELGGSVTYKERLILKTWIGNNKPTNWQTCTRKNTKAGDIVKNKVDEKVNYVIEQIYRETDNCTVWNIEVEKTTVNYVLSEFHIDLNNTEGK